MKRIYKQAYQAPQAQSLDLQPSLSVLDTLSISAPIEDPTYSGTFGELDSQDWGHIGPNYPNHM